VAPEWGPRSESSPKEGRGGETQTRNERALVGVSNFEVGEEERVSLVYASLSRKTAHLYRWDGSDGLSVRCAMR
jgi:hypothetical protein